MIQHEKYNFKTRDVRKFHGEVIKIYDNHIEVQRLSKTIHDKVYIVLGTEVIHLKDIKVVE